MRKTRTFLSWWCRSLALVAVLGLGLSAWAQHGGHSMTTTPPAPTEQPKPIRITMEELHRQGGIPPGWQFLMPPGDPQKGKKVYIAMECFTCHEIKGQHFPGAGKKPGDVGPELTGMGQHHPVEYLAEAIMNPNRVIIEGPGYTGPDGLSKMPDYNDSLTVRQLIDLVAYLKSLTPPKGH